MSDIRSKFVEVYSVLKSELLNDPAFEFTDDSRQWIDRVFPSLSVFLYLCMFNTILYVTYNVHDFGGLNVFERCVAFS